MSLLSGLKRLGFPRGSELVPRPALSLRKREQHKDRRRDSSRSRRSEYRKQNWIVGPDSHRPMIWAEFNDPDELDDRPPALTDVEQDLLQSLLGATLPDSVFAGWLLAIRRAQGPDDVPSFVIQDTDLGVWVVNVHDAKRRASPKELGSFSRHLSGLTSQSVPQGCCVVISSPSSNP